ncbi:MULTISPECIES: FAD binding domain-containing protein [Mycobacteriaceae]|uniref:FAD binding domain-containing protein n=1 Tax=Mycobacteriaceae TaxID=1762 RepID=UPI0007FF957E|nr:MULTISPECIES: FAD binding domain-containing protein [Mycobacteriaceae]MCK0174542.1 FAD binding domain-containing protein [Mycolicibacterium sp. F2034L]OBB59070.1 FAD-binding molybdopterin dehydrogenase [Mycobacterium sp. 852013-51886_SCH5428379]
MDLDTVSAVRMPAARTELWPMSPGDAVLAGGTWLYSEPQPHLRRLVDLTALGWRAIDIDDDGVRLAATCTIAELAASAERLPGQRRDWTAALLLGQCCRALLASPKIWHTATVGGNICLSSPAGAMISLATALDGRLTVWREHDSDVTTTADRFVTGPGANALGPGDVLREIYLPAAALRGRTALRKLASSPLGRSAVVVIGRRDAAADGGGFVLSVTAATLRPFVFRLAAPPRPEEVRALHASIPDDAWTDDPHGVPDWRRAMTLLLAQQVCRELS